MSQSIWLGLNLICIRFWTASPIPGGGGGEGDISHLTKSFVSRSRDLGQGYRKGQGLTPILLARIMRGSLLKGVWETGASTLGEHPMSTHDAPPPTRVEGEGRSSDIRGYSNKTRALDLALLGLGLFK